VRCLSQLSSQRELSTGLRRKSAWLLVLAMLSLTAHSQEPALRGYSPVAAKAERDWEQKFREVPDPARVRAYMQWITQEPHHAGSPMSKRVAEYILGKFHEWGLEAYLEEFEVLLPMPKERVLELLEPEKYVAQLREPPVKEDPNSTDANQLPTFNAYSGDGDVTAQLVYVNQGVPEDYDHLAKQGIDVKGKIVIARYGGSWRGIKPKVAAEHGAVGCLIFSDPKDDGYYQGDIYPEGAFRPPQGVQRGSVMDIPIYPGDPLTPGYAAVKGAKRLRISEAKTLMTIPVLPISYADATPLLSNLRGPVVPESWRGALPLTYHYGPGPAVVHLKTTFDWDTRPIYDVIARIPGWESPTEWVIYGNHHDAWVNGAADPTSGLASLMEASRGLATLVKQGWKPRRTIMLAAWDAEEWGLIGSTEWAEKHADELAQNAVMYINSDSNGRGQLAMSGSHSLERFINEVARDVSDPSTSKTVWQAVKDQREEQVRTEEDKRELRERADLRIGALGSGSDYTPFLQHLTISSLNLGFGESGGSRGVYHSIYDSFYWYSHFSDTMFVYGRALAQVSGTALMRMADAQLLPFDFIDLADTLARYQDELQKLREEKDPALDLGPLREGLDALKKSAAAYEAAAYTANLDHNLDEVNRILYRTERSLAVPQGLPRRPWYRHAFYAPGSYTGYAVKTLPGVREAIEAKQWNEARGQLLVLNFALLEIAKQVGEAAKKLQSK
jgi:N-acetylated-alpha-linked acidic dipeptidase